MPSLCASATALDSLPRHCNVRRPSTALNRLQLKKQGYQKQQEQLGLPYSHRPNLQRWRSKKPSRGLASNDLPLASSDLCDERKRGDRTAFSDGEDGAGNDSDDDLDEKKMIHFLADQRPSSASPTKSMTRYRAQQIKKPMPSSPETYIAPKKHSIPSVQARKRVVDASMISIPCNFQHTGHIGAASYQAIQPKATEQLKRQLCEVAAALKLVDDEPFSLGDKKPSLEGCNSRKHSSTSVTADAMKESPPSAQSRATDGPPTGPAALKRSPTKRKPVPGPRKLDVLYHEFKSAAEIKESEAMKVEPSAEATSNVNMTAVDVTADAERSDVIEKPLPTLRAANGKRLTIGPSGDYITDTANGRWMNNLSEITNALKAQGGDDDDDGEEMENLQDGLKRADLILSRLKDI